MLCCCFFFQTGVGVRCPHNKHYSVGSLVPRPERGEKRPSFHCLRMHLIIRNRTRIHKCHLRSHMVELVTLSILLHPSARWGATQPQLHCHQQQTYLTFVIHLLAYWLHLVSATVATRKHSIFQSQVAVVAQLRSALPPEGIGDHHRELSLHAPLAYYVDCTDHIIRFDITSEQT